MVSTDITTWTFRKYAEKVSWSLLEDFCVFPLSLPFTSSANCPLCLNPSRLNVWVWEFPPLPCVSLHTSCFTFSWGVHWTPQSDRDEITVITLRKHSNDSIWQCSIIVFEEIVVFGWIYLSLLVVLITTWICGLASREHPIVNFYCSSPV